MAGRSDLALVVRATDGLRSPMVIGSSAWLTFQRSSQLCRMTKQLPSVTASSELILRYEGSTQRFIG
jgi:hypothetical protein